MSINIDTVEPTVVDESVSDDLTLYEIGASSLPYFGADFDVAGLVRRLQDEDIIVPRFDPDESAGTSVEGFQRQRVWKSTRAESFIESLLLGWPVPSIFLVVEPDQRYLVLDGQQRLTTLRNFYEGFHDDGRPFVLTDVAEHLRGATYPTLSRESRRRLNNTFIQAVVIEPEGDNGRDSVYRLFGRLNSGGITLTPQEIRVALYRGALVTFIRELNRDPSWRMLFGAPHLRLKDHELILRVLAMTQVLARIDGQWDNPEVRINAYKPPMSRFLNTYLEEHREMEGLNSSDVAEAFAASCALVVQTLGSGGLRFAGRLNAAHVDALLSALMHLMMTRKLPSKRALEQAILKLRNPQTRYTYFVSSSTSHRDNVYGRLDLAVQALQ